jgi:hypothetical protein
MPTDGDLGPQPEPEIEPGEPPPGGPDAIQPDPEDGGVRDLDPENNPAVEDQAPADLLEGEDTSTEATEQSDDEDPTDVDKEESPA